MKIQVDSVSGVKKKISVHIPEERIQQEVSNALDKAQKSATVPGFRPGKAPRAMLEKKYGKAVEQEVCQDLVRTSMTQAIQENKLDAIAVSEVSEPKREIGQGFSYTASVEVRPLIEPTKYSGVTIKSTAEKVKPEDIDAVMTRLLDTHAVLKPKDTLKATKGDFVSMVVEQIDEKGNALEKTAPAEQLHEVGTAHARKEVDDAILSMSVGDFQDITLEQESAHEHNHAAGEACDHDHKPQTVRARLTLKAIKTKELPKVDDDFAKTVGPFEKLDDLKKQITDDLEKQMAEKNKVENVKLLIADVLKNNPAELPETLVENELIQLRQELFQHWMNSGITTLPKDFSDEKMRAELFPEAQRRVHEQLVLAAIAKKENISVTPQELNERVEQYAQMLKRPVAEVRKQYVENGRISGIEFQILAQKTLDFLLSQANIK